MMSETLYTDDYGDWRIVDDVRFDTKNVGNVLVSSRGYIRKRQRSSSKFSQPFKPSQNLEGYRNITIQKIHFRVCRLVLLVFVGPPPSDSHTADHIAKCGNVMIERGNDSLENLRWASRKEQRANQAPIKSRRDKRKVLVWKEGGEVQTFASASEAASHLGVRRGNIVNVCNGKGRAVRAGGWYCKWAEGEWFEDDGDEWREVTSLLKVSSQGKVSTRKHATAKWGAAAFVNEISRSYARVTVNGKERSLHSVMWNAFGDRPLEPGESIDHIDRDKTNNSIANLRIASRSLQSINQNKVKKWRGVPVEGRKDNMQWKRWSRQIDAAAETGIKQSKISSAIQKGWKTKGWEWRMCV